MKHAPPVIINKYNLLEQFTRRSIVNFEKDVTIQLSHKYICTHANLNELFASERSAIHRKIL